MSKTVEHYDPTLVSILLSDEAIKHIQVMIEKQPENKCLRLSTKKTGCSGFSYVTDLVARPEKDDVIVKLEQAIEVYMAKESIQYLNHLTLDYKKMAFGQSKLIYINPNATGECGCGESFITADNED